MEMRVSIGVYGLGEGQRLIISIILSPLSRRRRAVVTLYHLGSRARVASH